jgi:hypothetical protein
MMVIVGGTLFTVRLFDTLASVPSPSIALTLTTTDFGPSG